MKRLFSILAVAVVLVSACFVTSSCSKKSLKGTTWTYSPLEGLSSSYIFVDDTNVTLHTDAGGTVLEFSGTYTYADPNVTISIKDHDVSNGTISGDKLTITDTEGTIVYTKQ